MDAAEEARLLRLARRGDTRAFGQLVDAHHAPVRAFLRRLAGAEAEADDIAQEAFARTWQVLHRFDGRSSLRTFVCGVALHFWRRRRRASARAQARDQAYAALSPFETPRADVAQVLMLRRAMSALPEAQQAALALCLGQEFTHQEAADILRLPLGTVKSHVLRGRARLRAALGIVENADHD